MKKLVLIPLIFIALFTFTDYKRYSWRQKLTVTIETPTGEVSASSVSQVSWSKHWIQTDGMGWDYDLIGEAVVVEVKPGRYLFALLKGAGTAEYMGSVAAASIARREGRVIDGTLFDQVRDQRGRAEGVIAVPPYQYPMLVTFDDIADPESVHLVDPADLAASFGSGVRLMSVTLEVTDKAVTEDVVARHLAWLGKYPETKLFAKVSPTDFSPESQLDQGMFTRRR